MKRLSAAPRGRLRTGPFLRMLALTLCLAAGMACLPACEPAREEAHMEPAAAQAAGDRLARQEEMLALAGQGTPGCAGIPAAVSADMACRDARFTVSGEATVTVLGDGTFPIVRVKPAAFTNRQVRKMLRTLMPGATLYDVGDVRDKAHVEASIRALEAQKPFYEENDIEGYPVMLGILQEELAAAPEKVVGRIARKKLRPITETYGDTLTQTHMGLFVGESPIYGDPVRYLSVDNSADALRAEYRDVYGETHFLYDGNVGARAIFDDLRTESAFVSAAVAQTVSGPAVPSACAGKLELSPEEAAKRAERICQELGFDARAASVTLVKTSDRRVMHDDDFEADGFFYELRCTRRADGAGSLYLPGSAVAHGGMDGVNFGSWAFESITFYMDDLGVFRMEWASPCTVTETLVKASALLPFDQIMDRFRQSENSIFAGYLQGWDETAVHLRLRRAELGLVRIPAYDDPASGLLIPAWAFYGVLENAEEGITIHQNDGTTSPVLLINAITGDVMDAASVS